MSKIQKKDRRKFIRLKAHHLVKYRVLVAGQEHGARFMLATIKDIGGGGACLRLEERLSLASVIELRINFPHIDTSIYAIAKVVWTKEIKKPKFFEVGLEFTQIDSHFRDFIDNEVRLVYNKMKGKKFMFNFSKKEVKK